MAINKAEVFNIGDKIDIHRLGKDDKIYYPSQILDILDDDTFIVSNPTHKRNLIFLHKNEKVTVSCTVENQGQYSFDAIISNRYKKNIYALKLQRVSDVKRLQKRNYYRFDVELPVRKSFTIKQNNDEIMIIEECKTKDISGNGMRLLTDYKHNVGDIITCDFFVDSELINTEAKVVRVEKIDSFEYDFSIGICFCGLDEKNREKIIKFIFSKQRELREKGMI